MRTALFVLALFLSPPAALAQEPQAHHWIVFNDYDGAGVSVCPQPAGGDAPFFCLALTCPAPGAAMEWVVRLEGPAPTSGPQPLALSVDDDPADVVTLHPRKEVPGVQAYAAPFDPASHAALLTRLAKGQAARLTLGTGNGTGALTHALDLTGSARAIGQLPALCPDPRATQATGPAPRPYVPQPD